jgi:hypothetical protein
MDDDLWTRLVVAVESIADSLQRLLAAPRTAEEMSALAAEPAKPSKGKRPRGRQGGRPRVVTLKNAEALAHALAQEHEPGRRYNELDLLRASPYTPGVTKRLAELALNEGFLLRDHEAERGLKGRWWKIAETIEAQECLPPRDEQPPAVPPSADQSTPRSNNPMQDIYDRYAAEQAGTQPLEGTDEQAPERDGAV